MASHRGSQPVFQYAHQKVTGTITASRRGALHTSTDGWCAHKMSACTSWHSIKVLTLHLPPKSPFTPPACPTCQMPYQFGYQHYNFLRIIL